MATKGTSSYRISDPNGLYYLTITTVNWIDLFIRRENKEIIVESLQYCIDNKGLELFGYCIMTNHMHLICRAGEGFNLADIIRDFKRHTAKHLLESVKNGQESRREWMLNLMKEAGSDNKKNKEYQVWRQDNHPMELYSNEFIDQKLDYIHNNPVAAGFVKEPYEYLYSSARNYSHMEAVLEIDLI